MTLLNNKDGSDLILEYLNQGRIMDKKRIRAIRELYGLTQIAFADVIEVSYKNLSVLGTWF